jgi:hypothetical protein
MVAKDSEQVSDFLDRRQHGQSQSAAKSVTKSSKGNNLSDRYSLLGMRTGGSSEAMAAILGSAAPVASQMLQQQGALQSTIPAPAAAAPPAAGGEDEDDAPPV